MADRLIFTGAVAQLGIVGAGAVQKWSSLPDTGSRLAQAVAERIRQLLELEVVTVNGLTASVTATIALTQRNHHTKCA